MISHYFIRILYRRHPYFAFRFQVKSINASTYQNVINVGVNANHYNQYTPFDFALKSKTHIIISKQSPFIENQQYIVTSMSKISHTFQFSQAKLSTLEPDSKPIENIQNSHE